MKKVLGVMVVLLLAVSFLAACGPGTPAEFTLSSVGVSPSAAGVNDTVTISASVTNVGEESGGCDVSLTIDGHIDSESVTLAGGESSSVSFSYAATTEGSYTVTLSTPDDSETRTLTVTEEAPPPPPGAPVLSAGDTWTYDVLYEDPGGLTEQDSGGLNITMVAEVEMGGEASYYLSGAYVPEATRDATIPGLQLTVGAAEIWTSKDHVEYLKQGSTIAQLAGVPSTVTWTYDGDYGWPYEVGKTWSYTAYTEAGPIKETAVRESKVLGIETITVPAGIFSCYHIVAYDPASPDTYTNEHWFNATVVKSDVKMIVRDTWAGEETMVLTSYPGM